MEIVGGIIDFINNLMGQKRDCNIATFPTEAIIQKIKEMMEMEPGRGAFRQDYF